MPSQDTERVYYFGNIQVDSAAELKQYHHYTHVVGNIEIKTDDDAFIAWPKLRAVAGDLVVSENEGMTHVEFPSLDRVYGALLLDANPSGIILHAGPEPRYRPDLCHKKLLTL